MATLSGTQVMARYFNEAWNQAQLDVLEEIIAPDYINHTPAVPGLPQGVVGVKAIFGAFHAAFAKLHFDILDQVSEGDKIVTFWQMEGIQQGNFLGIPPTGKPFRVLGFELDRVVNGKITEHWLVGDTFGLMQQLGVVPTP